MWLIVICIITNLSKLFGLDKYLRKISKFKEYDKLNYLTDSC